MRRRRGGFTLSEMMVVSSVLAVLAAILFPVFAQARGKAAAAACLSNVKQLGAAFTLYADDNDGCLPRIYWPGFVHWWFEVLQPYTRSEAVFRCPAVTWQGPNEPWAFGWQGYGINVSHVVRVQHPCCLSAIERPAETMILADSQANAGWAAGAGYPAVYCKLDYPTGVPVNLEMGITQTWGLSDRHAGGLHALFVDGHAKWMSRKALLTLPRGQAALLWGHE